jgi:hypothetical protein
MAGEDVEAWQRFLAEEGLSLGVIDGAFGLKTEKATKEFQRRHMLVEDGLVGRQTYEKALQLGYDPIEWPEAAANKKDPYWPPVPTHIGQPSTRTAERLFGKFVWRSSPTESESRAIEILDDWPKRNLVTVEIPQLAKIGRPLRTPRVTVHKLAAKPMQKLWQAWEDAGLLKLVLTWDGLYNPRVIGGTKSLSNHAYGAAFDINAPYNRWGGNVPLVGEKGAVRELVPLANEHGFWWGGHYKGKKDGMHFELAKV